MKCIMIYFECLAHLQVLPWISFWTPDLYWASIPDTETFLVSEVYLQTIKGVTCVCYTFDHLSKVEGQHVVCKSLSLQHVCLGQQGHFATDLFTSPIPSNM